MAGEDYKQILTELVQKQMVVLGPNIALDKARQVAGLSLSDQGAVLAITGEPKMVLKALAEEYILLSGPVAKMTLASLMEKYPSIKGL